MPLKYLFLVDLALLALTQNLAFADVTVSGTINAEFTNLNQGTSISLPTPVYNPNKITPEWRNYAGHLLVAEIFKDLISENLELLEGNSLIKKPIARLNIDSRAIGPRNNSYNKSIESLELSLPLLTQSRLDYEYSTTKIDETSKKTSNQIAFTTMVNENLSLGVLYAKSKDELSLEFPSWVSDLNFDSNYERVGSWISLNPSDEIKVKYQYSQANGVRGAADIVSETETFFHLEQLAIGAIWGLPYEDKQYNINLTYSLTDNTSIWFDKQITDYEVQLPLYSCTLNSAALAIGDLVGAFACSTSQLPYDFTYEIKKFGATHTYENWTYSASHIEAAKIPFNTFELGFNPDNSDYAFRLNYNTYSDYLGLEISLDIAN